MSFDTKDLSDALERVSFVQPTPPSGIFVVNLDPELPGPIIPSQILGFDVVCYGAGILIVVFSLSFEGFEVEEMVYDGNTFCGAYSGTVTEIANGLQYRFQRRGGFPGSPRMKVRAVSDIGGINE